MAEHAGAPSSSQTTNNGNTTDLKGFAALSNHISHHKIDVTLWFTRLLNMCFTFFYFIPIFGSQLPAYQKAVISSAVTSALRLFQRQPSISLSQDYIMKAVGEDSFHYFAFSILFVCIRPVALAVVPLFLFSLLHFSSYSLVMMDLFGTNSLWVMRLFIHIVEFQSIKILHIIALAEIFLMPYLICLAFMGYVGFTVVFVYYEFLIMRCRSRRNPYTRNVFHELRLRVNSFACQPGVPGWLKSFLLKATYLISKLGLYNMDVQD